MIKATGYLVAILSVAACSTDTIDSTETPAASVFRIDQSERATDGVPYFVHGTLGGVTAPIRSLADVDGAMSAALPDIGRAISVPADQLVALRVEHDELGMTHIRYAQRVNGFDVVAGTVIVHVANDGTIVSVSNGTRDASTLPTVPQLSATYAADLARTHTPKAISASVPDLVYVVTNGHGDIRFAWRTEVTGPMLRDTVFVDAMSGEVVARHPHIQPAKSRTIFSGADIQDLTVATQIASEGTPPTDEVAKAAYDNTGTTYDCYKEMFQRDSYDAAGAELKSIVHVTDFQDDPQGHFDNAFWDGTEMVYGDGDGTEFTELARALDVTAHELTHAVTERTAALVYSDESGGLNEATSDILGNSCEAHRDGMVSDNTWLVGEDIFTPGVAGDALRYMNNPTLDASLYPPGQGLGSIDFYGDYQQGIDVHFSSGIANLFYYLVTVGGPHPRAKTPYTVVGIGIDKAEQIWYRALTTYFMPNETFAMARTDTEHAAMDLFPGATKTAVSMAWATVGVGTAPLDTSPPTVTITAPGESSMVNLGFVVTADATDDQGILRVDFSIDGTVVGSSTTAPYMFTSATSLAFGPHMVEATAFDAVNHTSDSVMVTIIDPTCGNTCTSDQTCDMMTGLCVDNGGCCSTGGPVGGSLLLIAGTALVLSRRRRR